jgi:hypothetical protein
MLIIMETYVSEVITQMSEDAVERIIIIPDHAEILSYCLLALLQANYGQTAPF